MNRPATVDLSFTSEDDVPESWRTMDDEKVLVLMPSPANIVVVSSSQGGKSTFVHRLLKDDLFRDSPEKVLYCYNSTWQPRFTEMESEMKNITFLHGMPDEQVLEEFQTSTRHHKVIILDDLMLQATNADSILNLFTVGTHHNFCSVILLTHNLFPKSKHGRTLSLNTHVFVIMANTRDKQQIDTLGRQLGYKNLLKAYTTATPEPYKYFIIDLHNHTPKELRLRSNVFTDEKGPTAIYKA